MNLQAPNETPITDTSKQLAVNLWAGS